MYVMDMGNKGVGQNGHKATHAWFNMCEGKLGMVPYGHGGLIGMW